MHDCLATPDQNVPIGNLIICVGPMLKGPKHHYLEGKYSENVIRPLTKS